MYAINIKYRAIVTRYKLIQQMFYLADIFIKLN